MRTVVKGSRWLLVRNRENIGKEDRVRLAGLLAANRALAATYLLKDDLKHLWDSTPAKGSRVVLEGVA